MAPARNANRRVQREHTSAQLQNVPIDIVSDLSSKSDLFLEPMMGTPLAIYVHKDVQNRDTKK